MERLTEKQRHILQQKLCDMKRRCYNPEEKFYKDYGGRGIKVCDEWMDKKEVLTLPTWEGDAIFLKLLIEEDERRFFTLRLVYEGNKLVEKQLYRYS